MGENGRVARAVGCLAEVGGSASPGELGAALGVGHTTQAKVTAELLSAGLVTGGKSRVTLTSAGWARAGLSDGAGAGRVLDVAAAGWPWAHRAFVELLCSAVVARHHLAAQRPRGHLGFMAVGETATGKTSPAEQVCHLFALDVTAVKRHLYSETAGSLLGRREADGDGYRLVPSEAAALPLVLLDEFDKGEEAVRRAAWAFFQGQSTVRHEGQAWELRPVPVLTANPPATGDRYRLLRPEYRRRCAVLDTGYMRGRGSEIEDMLTRHYRAARAGALRLDQLTPPVGALDERALEVLRAFRDTMLTDAGREEFPGVEALELAALGRLALMASTDHVLAAYATALAYLQVTETVPGQVNPGWQLDAAAVRQYFGEHGTPLAEAIERGRAGREMAARQMRAQVTEREAIGDELTAAIGELAERLRLAAARLEPRKLGGLDDERKAKAAGVRDALAKVRKQVRECRSAERLSELTGRAALLLDAAGTITGYLEAERARQAREKHDAAEQSKRDKQAQDAAETEQRKRNQQVRAACRRQLAEVTGHAKELEQLYKRQITRAGESPLEILAACRISGRPLLTYVQVATDPPAGRLARLAARLSGPPSGIWRVTGSDVEFPGWPRDCPALARWGRNTRAVIAPTLAALHQAENQLCASLGRAPRKTRPALPSTLAGVATGAARAALAASSGLPSSYGG